jgi:hypothetical protein
MPSSTTTYYDYSVINFASILNRTNVDVINYFDDYGVQLRNGKDFKKIFLHFCIKRICDECLAIKGPGKKILFCNPEFVDKRSEIFESIDYNEYIKFISGTLDELSKFLPVDVFMSSDVKFEDIQSRTVDNNLKYDFDMITTSSSKRKSIKHLVEYANELGLKLIGKDFSSRPQLHKIYI